MKLNFLICLKFKYKNLGLNDEKTVYHVLSEKEVGAIIVKQFFHLFSCLKNEVVKGRLVLRTILDKIILIPE